MIRALALVGCLALVAACSGDSNPTPTPTAAPTQTPAATPTLNAPVGTVDPSTDAVIDAVIADAARLMDRDREEFVVVRAERGTWSDSSLGCAFPNEGYDQAVTEGYWIVIRAGGIEVDYRVSTAGAMTICTIPARDRQGPIS